MLCNQNEYNNAVLGEIDKRSDFNDHTIIIIFVLQNEKWRRDNTD
jgi:hypothetical protein